jgi:hypothetical protein
MPRDNHAPLTQAQLREVLTVQKRKIKTQQQLTWWLVALAVGTLGTSYARVVALGIGIAFGWRCMPFFVTLGNACRAQFTVPHRCAKLKATLGVALASVKGPPLPAWYRWWIYMRECAHEVA